MINSYSKIEAAAIDNEMNDGLFAMILRKGQGTNMGPQ